MGEVRRILAEPGFRQAQIVSRGLIPAASSPEEFAALIARDRVTERAELPVLDGVRFTNGCVRTHSLVMNSATRTVSELRVKQPV